MGQKEELWLIC
uniref:Uncharacterized protein n=1 Tax=Oryza nivara TaxID=4536 RepID=A0A0E0IV94_ORYNI